ncbi:tetratricopeptide repeat protein [Magnetospirillum sulfuroxidans]|uniref:protein O-GlcNAc transferase n=1 Tax=Magnetospirillum sulfuroxidans TaxID=611300 RepID=A0ABS5IB57_9PROT|nr:glycosyltransferase family 41 protein [Magnetospirillum sulfuroxidans]MBR9971367.1 tetratricopeptide repeat protein [Magnetospirillum sulfuroxidans]
MTVLQKAERLIRAGQLIEACEYLRDAVAADPRDVELRRLLGRVEMHLGRHQAAEIHFTAAVAEDGENADACFELGVCRLALGADAGAAEAFRRALAVRPTLAQASYNLGWALRRQGRDAEAEEIWRGLTIQQPGYVDAWYNLGNLLAAQERLSEALEALSAAHRLQPERADILANMGHVHDRMGACDLALDCFQRACHRAPDNAAVLNAHGNLLVRLGQAEQSLEVFRRAEAVLPMDAATACNHAIALQALGRWQSAVDMLMAVAPSHPNHAGLWNQLGVLELKRGRLAAAAAALARALSIDPDHVDALGNLGAVKNAMGDSVGGIECLRRAMALAPDNFALYSNLLYFMVHDLGLTHPDVVAEHRRFGQRLEAHIHPMAPRPQPDYWEAARLLRVGYVSPDFKDHIMARFIEPILAHHDPRRVHTYCYHTGVGSDAVTDRLRSLAREWRHIAHLSPEQAARLIREDEIDILIDLAGHTAGNGLPIFAFKPAPVQASWIGYPGTTGMTRIDFKMTDTIANPRGQNDHCHSEKLSYTPGPPFRLPEEVALRPDAPMMRKGYPTFGSCNKIQKITDETVILWSRVLAACPSARLVIFGVDDVAVGHELSERFQRHGIAPERLETRETMALSAFLSAIGDIDIALDTHPYGGATTSLFTLFMGVPVVCLDVVSAASSTTPAALRAVGLATCIAGDAQHYVEQAKALAADPVYLSKIRQPTRQALASWLKTEEKSIVWEVESIYQRWWFDIVGFCWWDPLSVQVPPLSPTGQETWQGLAAKAWRRDVSPSRDVSA